MILHSSRSTIADRSAIDEYHNTARWCQTNPDELSWNATIGPGRVAIHLGAGQWGWNAREHSLKFLAVEFSQPRVVDPIGDDQVDAFCWWFANVARLQWPDLPAYFVCHASLPAGIRDGKSDAYPAGPQAEDFRARVLARLDAWGVS